MRQLVSGRSAQAGDTIIEVVFAIVIFSFVAISSMAIMNQGIAAGEKALETTLVRQQINAQAEALRFVHEAAVVAPKSPHAITWRRLVTQYQQQEASRFGVQAGECVVPKTEGNYRPFVLNARTAEIWSTTPSVAPAASQNFPPYPQVIYDGSSNVEAAYGMWVESVPSSAALARRFVDFHIRACWPAPGSAVPMTLGTIVRLYDPR